MSGRTSQKVVVLMGGKSAEREVSLVSGRECAQALVAEGFEVEILDVAEDVAARLIEMHPDVAFNALHGRWGEDGCVQGILEFLEIPYTHSGVLASALAMNKERAKQVFAAAGLPVAESILLPRETVAKSHAMDPPYVVKPNCEGSSVGVYLVTEAANGPPQLDDNMPDTVMVEKYVPGRELTVSVLGHKALGVTEIFAEGWYDYHAKYAPGGSTHVIPADIPEEIAALCRAHARRAHKVLGCRGLSRSDFRWDEAKGVKGLILLETNTQPGMTPTSLAPEQAEAEGMSFRQLCRWLVEDATCNR